MKSGKKILAFLACFAILLSYSTFVVVPISAHEELLEVDYDNCDYVKWGDGLNEAWYVLGNGIECAHISHEVTTIKYCFMGTWTIGDITELEANAIKEAYANSMKKWNNVYFYTYDASGEVVKHKIVNVIEVEEGEQNLSIYPMKAKGIFAMTLYENNSNTSDAEENHIHYSEWRMNVSVVEFIERTNTTWSTGETPATVVAKLKERTGAHELGHVLGLGDIDADNCCNAETDEDHHHEILMGYGLPITERTSSIAYKDIAGAAITRGFHTDADHKWLNCGMQSDGQYKLVCTICNGVKKVDSLNGYTSDTYGVCNGNHDLADGNMMAVASYGNKDYYKCKYCRYVAPFSDLATQDYIAYSISDTHHEYRNRVTGLAYEGTEEHTVTEHGCICGYGHVHSYGNGTYRNHSMHLARCECGLTRLETHYVRGSDIVDGRYATCLGCNHELDLLVDQAEIGIYSVMKVSVNGSYILDNGIVVLADADLTAYLNGTLQFYDPDKLPTVA